MDKQLEEISEQAFVWAVLLVDGPLDEVEEFMTWLRTSQIHMDKLLYAIKVIRSVNAHVKAAANEPSLPRIPKAGEHSRWRRRRLALTALSIAACCAIVVAIVLLLGPTPHPTQLRYATADGDNWKLPDGTLVQAGPNTDLVLDYSDSVRGVELRRGRAMFDVVPNPHRPFIVSAAHTRARAVGTRFSMVAEGPDEAMVDVEEGVVKVNGSADGGGDSSVTLRAGYEARASRGDVSAYPIDVDTVFEWVHQPLTFEGQTIGQAVDAFNVRNRARIVIKDPALAQKTFSGTFYSKDLQKFASVLKARGVEVAITEDSGTPPPTP